MNLATQPVVVARVEVVVEIKVRPLNRQLQLASLQKEEGQAMPPPNRVSEPHNKQLKVLMTTVSLLDSRPSRMQLITMF